MTQKRDRIVAWAVRRDAIAKVTARLKGEEPRPMLAAADIRTYARSRLAEWYGNQWGKVVSDIARLPCPLTLDDILDYKTEPASDDRLDALKYAFWSMPVLKPESIVKVDIT